MTPHRFQFATTNRIIFGAGTGRELPQLVLGLTRRAFVVANGEGMRAAPTEAALQAAGTATELCGVAGESTAGAARARPHRHVSLQRISRSAAAAVARST